MEINTEKDWVTIKGTSVRTYAELPTFSEDDNATEWMDSEFNTQVYENRAVLRGNGGVLIMDNYLQRQFKVPPRSPLLSQCLLWKHVQEKVGSYIVYYLYHQLFNNYKYSLVYSLWIIYCPLLILNLKLKLTQDKQFLIEWF